MASSRPKDDDFYRNVFIKDSVYSWLPARLLETNEERQQALVRVQLPEKWHSTTVLKDESEIDDLEDALMGEQSEGHRGDSAAFKTVDLKNYPPYQELPLQNAGSAKRDMADLPHLHGAAILYNIKERHAQQQPYTRVGDIVVAVNPFIWLTELYSDEKRDLYAQNLVWKAPMSLDSEEASSKTSAPAQSQFGSMYDTLGFDPHVYEVSSLAYRGLAAHRQDQTLLVSGESGAGKTETVKIVLRHLATLESTRPRGDDEPQQVPMSPSSASRAEETIRRVLESSPVFEAFGNAKTIRNDNSSRFGKFTQLQFKVEEASTSSEYSSIPPCHLAGSTAITYLLEKSRVVSHSPGERNYHIFYQMFTASPEFCQNNLWPFLEGWRPHNFEYMKPKGGSGTDADADGNEEQRRLDSLEWTRVLEALQVFGFDAEENQNGGSPNSTSLKTLVRALCIVLQLGNLTFDEDPVDANITMVASREHLLRLSEMTGIDADDLERDLTRKLLKTSFDEVEAVLRPAVAKDSCDALAKELYSRIFNRVVRRINECTSGATQDAAGRVEELRTISMLDIFGFEKVQVNRFEQLCINYANEQLQQKYVDDIFQDIQKEYQEEGLELFDFSRVDNSKVLNLFDGRIGLLASLNEECIRPNGNDESFVYKVKIVHSEHECLISEKLHLNTEFGIVHSAGEVTYDASKFVERNTDKLPEGLMECVSRSSNVLLREEFQAALLERSQSRKKPTVLGKFRGQMKDLLKAMRDSQTRYIRCIRPNDTFSPGVMDHASTMRQLECAGLVTAVEITREIFTSKLTYEAISSRFGCLMRNDKSFPADAELRDRVRHMLDTLLLPENDKKRSKYKKMPYEFGKTQVYFRSGALEELEMKRLDFLGKHATVIQRWIRGVQARQRFLATRAKVTKVQALARGRQERQLYEKKRAAATILSSAARQWQAKKTVDGMRKEKAARTIQKGWAARAKETELDRFRKAAIVLQRAVRYGTNRASFATKLAKCVEEARMDHKLATLKQHVADKRAEPSEDGTTRKLDNDTLLEIENMLDYSRQRMFELRKDNADLETRARGAEGDGREHQTQIDSLNAFVTTYKARVAELTKRNTDLVNIVFKNKEEALDSRKELKELKTLHTKDIEETKAESYKVVLARDREILKLKKTIKRNHLKCEDEKARYEEEIIAIQEKQIRTVKRLKDELRKTQESHHDYLTNLMHVLEKTHAAREKEMARVSEELASVKKEKDEQIRQLNRKLHMLRSSVKTGGKTQSLQQDLQTRDLSTLRGDIERSNAARNKRAKQFNEVCRKLETSIASSASSEKQTKLIKYLEELYAMEEVSQSVASEETLYKLDQFVIASEPNAVIAGLQARIEMLMGENASLRKEASTKSICERCASRDARRSASQRALGQWTGEGGGGYISESFSK